MMATTFNPSLHHSKILSYSPLLKRILFLVLQKPSVFMDKIPLISRRISLGPLGIYILAPANSLSFTLHAKFLCLDRRGYTLAARGFTAIFKFGLAASLYLDLKEWLP